MEKTRRLSRLLVRHQRVLIWSLPVVVALGFALAQQHLSEKESLLQARGDLIEGRLKGAAAVFEALQYSLWSRREARAGLAISAALAGEQSSRIPSRFDRESLQAFPLRLLLYRALHQADYEGCIRLAELLLRELGDPRFALFKSSALLELGRKPESLRQWESIPEELRQSRLGLRLKRTQELLEEDSHSLVYDRDGRPLGTVDRGGRFRLLDSVPAGLLPLKTIEPLLAENGARALRLSLDLELSRLALEALGDYRGTVALVEAQSGQVLVAVSDELTARRDGDSAFLQLREPASIAKLITTTAGLRAGLDVNAEIAGMNCRGSQRYGGGILYCSYRAGPLRGLNRAMAVSCNIAFANLGVGLGREALLEEFGRYGFNRPAASGMQFGTAGPVRNRRQLADLSIGLERAGITPLHAALLAAVFANDGRMPEPTLIRAYDGLLGLSPRDLPAKSGRRVIDPKWVSVVTEAMEAVVSPGGTAWRIGRSAAEVVMKTGTGRHTGLGYHTNYVGIFPQQGISFCVRITHQRTSSRVRRATVRVARQLLSSVTEEENADELGQLHLTE